MRKYEQDTTIAAEVNKTATPTSEANTIHSIALTAEQETAFVKVMKIGYYKEFYRQGLITAEQLEALIAMQDKSEHKKAA